MSSISSFQSLFGRDPDTGEANQPWDYQREVARALRERRNVVLTAPTGAGKTLAVLAPFLAFREEIGARRLIYCLPMKTLAQGIHAESTRISALAGIGADRVTLQTGDHRGDPFFIIGDIVVCTYDQFLSGLLCGSYSLSKSQRNINAGAAAGNLVVFDEFHLMETGLAFLAALTCLDLFRDCCRSVWMTATATDPLTQKLIKDLDATPIALTPAEMAKVERDRSIQRKDVALTAAEVLAETTGRTLVVVNVVRRARDLFEEVRELAKPFGVPDENIILLHSRFFGRDKEAKRVRLYELMGKGTPMRAAIVIATQVVEAGLDISAERLLTDLCPMNALVQRAGRCARFRGQSGQIVVFRGPDFDPMPYRSATLDLTWRQLESPQTLTNAGAMEWTNLVHRETDEASLRENTSHPGKCKAAILEGIKNVRQGGVGTLIRTGSQNVEVFILEKPNGVRPATREAISVTRNQLYRLLKEQPGTGYQFDPDVPELWAPLEDPRQAYFVALPPAVARYTKETGLVLGREGTEESPEVAAPKGTCDYVYRREGWTAHTQLVTRRAAELLHAEAPVDGLLGARIGALSSALRNACQLHDLGKLQESWQAWASNYEKRRDPGYLDLEPLAHTECQDANDRRINRAMGRKPPHSAASATYAGQLLDDLPSGEWLAVIAAIVGHHGGWFSPDTDRVDRLEPRAAGLLTKMGFTKRIARPDESTVRQDAQGLIDSLEKVWVLVALVTRFLRIADQKATKEAANSE